jgi:putative DNA primase/helicase
VGALGLGERDLFSTPNGDGHPRSAQSSPPKPRGKGYPTIREALDAMDTIMERKQGKRVDKWRYHDANGKCVALVLRYDLPPDGGKQPKTFRPMSRHGDRWYRCDPPGKWPLYRLSELVDAPKVYVVEGEKCADALAALGLAATTSAHGARAPGKTDWTPLAGKEIILIPDNDEPGSLYVEQIASILRELNP